jgi:hypothetical protein
VPTDSSSGWPDGIAGYDKIIAETKPRYTLPGGLRREREAIEPYMKRDERVTKRHFVSEISRARDRGQLLYDGAVVLLPTTKRLLIVSSHGTFRPKLSVDTIHYSELQAGVFSMEPEINGLLTWVAGFKRRGGESYLLQFHKSDQRDEFVRDFGGILGAWQVTHPGE